MKYRQQYDGDWIKPKMKGYRVCCCDCGLVHEFNFKIVKSGNGHAIMYQPRRLPRSTAAARRASRPYQKQNRPS